MTRSLAGACRRLIAGLLGVALTGCGDPVSGPGTFDAAAAFEGAWATFDGTYSYFDYKRIDWDSLGEVYRAQVTSGDSPEQLIAVLQQMTMPLRDVHVTFISPAGEQRPSWVPQHAVNWDRATWARHVGPRGWQQRPNWGHARFDDIGYIAFGGWTSGITLAAVDSVLEELRGVAALIIDVRPNGGGDDRIALGVAARFAPARTHIESVRFRDGPRHSDFGPPIDRYLEPRGAWQFMRPVVVLAGRAVYSSNETFVAAMRELPHVTIIGDTTGGSSGNPAEHALGAGWTYRVPRWMAFLVDGTVIEWNGIPPDIVLPTAGLAFGGDTDPVIGFAEAWLREQRQGAH